MVLRDTGKKRILVVEDEEHIGEGIRLNLTLRGYESRVAADGVTGLAAYKEWRPDLVILDLMLPGMDGYAVLKAVRLEDERLPVLILSARGDAQDKIRGFSYGVDDYLSKPFNLEELLLRVERLLTRHEWAAGTTSPPADEEGDEVTFGGNRVNLGAYSAQCRIGEVVLSEQEVRLLRVFFKNEGTPLSRAQLLELAWGYTGETNTRTVDNFIVRLRKYFEENPKKPVYFRSLRSVGYVFDRGAK